MFQFLKGEQKSMLFWRCQFWAWAVRLENAIIFLASKKRIKRDHVFFWSMCYCCQPWSPYSRNLQLFRGLLNWRWGSGLRGNSWINIQFCQYHQADWGSWIDRAQELWLCSLYIRFEQTNIISKIEIVLKSFWLSFGSSWMSHQTAVWIVFGCVFH